MLRTVKSMQKFRKVNRVRFFSQEDKTRAALKKKLSSEICSIYRILDDLTQVNLTQARKNGKKLLLTVADKVDEDKCLVTHLTMNEIMKQNNINHLLTPMDEHILKYILTDNHEELKKHLVADKTTIDVVIKDAVQKDISILPIHLPNNIETARKVITDNLIQLNQDVLFIVGALYYPAIANNAALKEKYEIIYINPHYLKPEDLTQLLLTFDMTDEQEQIIKHIHRSRDITQIHIETNVNSLLVDKKWIANVCKAELSQLVFDLAEQNRPDL